MQQVETLRDNWLRLHGVDINIVGEVTGHKLVMRDICAQADKTRHPDRIERHGNLEYTVFRDNKPAYRVCAPTAEKPFSHIITY